MHSFQNSLNRINLIKYDYDYIYLDSNDIYSIYKPHFVTFLIEFWAKQ